MFKRPMDVGLSYTVTCPLSCRHCITQSSPKMKGKMSEEQARAYLDVIPRYSISVCFTGGEPLLYHSEIVQAARYATESGLYVSVVTGAGWVESEEDTIRKVRELANAGVKLMSISWDIYHQEASQMERARLLARIAAEEKIRIIVRAALPPEQDPAIYRAAFEGIPVAFQESPLIRLGRAKTLPLKHFSQYDEPPKGECPVVLSLVIEYTGSVYACCGPSHFSAPHSPLVLGNTNEEPLADILDRALSDPILDIISLVGPYGLYLLLEQAGSKSLLPVRGAYTSICDLCLDLTNSPQIISVVREQLKQGEAQRFITAARLWMEKKLWPEKMKASSNLLGSPSPPV